mgnify:FL=1
MNCPKIINRCGYYYLIDGIETDGKNKFILWDLTRWDLLKIWWVCFWAWFKG